MLGMAKGVYDLTCALSTLQLSDGSIAGWFLSGLVPSLTIAQGDGAPSAGTPLDLMDVERAGVSAGDPGLNVSSQLFELQVVEVVFLFHLARCLALFMANVKAGELNEFMPL